MPATAPFIQLTPSIVWVVLALLLAGCDEKDQKAMSEHQKEHATNQGLYFSTATENIVRARVLPAKGSEDVSSLLGEISAEKHTRVRNEDYLPNTDLEWVVYAKPEKPLKAKEVAAKFGKEWRVKYGGMIIYGLNPDTGHWTYLVSSESPEHVSELQFAWTYAASWSEDDEIVLPAMYDSRLEAVNRGLNGLTVAKVSSKVSSKDAHARAVYLRTLNNRYDHTITVRLVAPSGKRFSGREVWDVILCLGLQWGDMDCFHWPNNTGQGDDHFFSVWTSTHPGYFLPEEVAADRVKVEDLVFGFSIPRSAAPVTVYSRMLLAVEYAQKRLGGSISSGDGKTLNAEATSKEIKSIAEELDKLGFKPGSENALRQF